MIVMINFCSFSRFLDIKEYFSLSHYGYLIFDLNSKSQYLIYLLQFDIFMFHYLLPICSFPAYFLILQMHNYFLLAFSHKGVSSPIIHCEAFQLVYLSFQVLHPYFLFKFRNAFVNLQDLLLFTLILINYIITSL